MIAKALAYLSGFFKEGTPQSMVRLCAFLSTFTACVVGIIGACRQWDSSMIVLALGGAGSASLFARKKGPGTEAPPTEEAKG